MSAPERLSPFGPGFTPGRGGASGAPAVTMAERRVDIVQVMAGHGADAAVGSALPGPGKARIEGPSMTVWIQPSGWLMIRPRGPEGVLAKTLASTAGDTVAVVDQGHGKSVLRLTGARAGDVLAKGSRVDLHPRAFPTGSAATTSIDHITVTIVKVDASTFDLVLPANFSEAFADWLKLSAAEFGYEITEAV